MSNALKTIEEALARIREKCTPGNLPCLWETAYHRVLVLDIARDDLADGAVIDYTDEMIRAEFDRLLIEHPEAPVCACHAGLTVNGGVC
jgi:hypothetical protein